MIRGFLIALASLLLFVALTLLFIGGVAVAQVGTPIPSGDTVTVDAHGECRLVTNHGAGIRMVFTGTAPEWQSFRDNPNGLTMADCCFGTWTARESNRDWRSIASSADGAKLVAVVYGGQIYTSTDSGATWTARNSNRTWWSVASSADGTKLVALELGGRIYTSTNSGATWTARANSIGWNDVASSADGMKLVAGANGASGERIYTSNNSGVTWTARANNQFWRSVASSADGVKLVAVVHGGQIYTSTNSGVAWTARESNRNWYGVASSTDGTKLVAVVKNGQIYTSADSGVTWTARESNRNWESVASSADGTKLAAAVLDGQIYTSSDSGITWTARGDNSAWHAVALSADGTQLVAGVNSGQIFISSCTATNACGSDGQGVDVGGACWYMGSNNQNCDAVCSAHGMDYDAATRTFAGDQGTSANCHSVLDALGQFFGSVGTDTSDQGCWIKLSVRTRGTQVTTSNAASTLGARACACTTTPPPSEGVEVGGFKWYQGGQGDSCQTVCAPHGGVNMNGTAGYVGVRNGGSSGTLPNCVAVAAALGISSPADSYNSSCSAGLGCQITNFTTGGYENEHEVFRCSSPVTNETATPTSFSGVPTIWAPDALSGYNTRVCACNNGYTDLMVDGAPSPHQSDTTLRWLIDRLRS